LAGWAASAGAPADNASDSNRMLDAFFMYFIILASLVLA
jgi:hypothetical protein